MTTPDTTPGDEKQAITADIEATRERLGETVEELAHRLDVKAQVQGKVDETKQAVQAKVDGVKSTVKSTVGTQATQLRTYAMQAGRRREVQIPAAIAAAAAVLGLLLMRRGS